MLNRIISLIIKEFLTIWKDPKSRSIIIVPPILMLLFFANAITMEVRNIDMAVVDNSNTVESRELISRFDNSPRFRHIYHMQNEIQARNAFDIQALQVILEINNDFSKEIKRGKPASVQVVVDGRQTNSAGIISAYASQIITGYGMELNPQKEGASINAVVRNWFNPNLEYTWFLLASLIAILSLIVSLMLTALSIARERELGTFDQLIVSPLTAFEILVGKTVPPLIISVCMSLFLLAMSMIFFKLPFVGSIFLYLLGMLAALLSIVGVGLCISSICKTQQQAILGSFVFQMPSTLLSGFISPIEDMPVVLQYFTYANPLRFFMTITKGLFFKGMELGDVLVNIIPMVIIAFITLSIAGWMFKRRLD